MAINKPSDNAVPFARDGLKNTIPVEPGNGNAASMKSGFPAITMQPKSTGGLPPSGRDMNAILNQLSQHQVWLNAGGMYPFNAAYAAQIGGYHVGAVVQSDDGRSAFISVQDNNFNNPNQMQTGWKPYAGQFLLTTLANAIFHVGSRHMTGNSSYNPATALEALFGYQTTWYLWPYIPIGVANTGAALGEIITVGGTGVQAATTRIWERLPDGGNAPTYTLTASQTTVDEGQQVTFNLSTTGLAQGTPVAWNITGIQSTDITPNALTGQFIVGADGTATYSLTVVEDAVGDETETLKFALTYISNKFVNVVIGDTTIVEQIVTISSDSPGLNLRGLFNLAYGQPTSTTRAVFIIESGVKIIADSVSAPAIYGDYWPAGSTREIRVMPNAFVSGMGGAGGAAFDVDDSPEAKKGGDGGTAIEAAPNSPIVINNYGLVTGGGAGGGASGTAFVVNGGLGYSGVVLPGSGGAPYGPSGLVSKNREAEPAGYQGYGLHAFMDFVDPSPTYKQIQYLHGIWAIKYADGTITQVTSPPKLWTDAGLNTVDTPIQGYFSYRPSTAGTRYCGGKGGNWGENGASGTLELNPPTSDGTWEVLSAPGLGGLAGYIYQGPVTINNLSGGQSKGRTP